MRYLTGDTHPDHDTICTFRQEHRDAIKEVFLQVLRLAKEMGVLKVGTVSVDGTHIKCGISSRKNTGIAVPHCKTPNVKTLTLAIGISPEGIDFDAIDAEPSNLFFCMLAPPDQSGPHIEALAEIARLTQSQSFCRLLKESQNAEEVVELFRD